VPPVPDTPGLQRLQKLITEANRENDRNSFRGVAIIWASFLDDLLKELLEAHACRTAASCQDARKKDTFGNRITRALRLDPISQDEADRCRHIQAIRNATAHEWDLSIENKDVLANLRSLYEADHANYLVFHEDLEFLIRLVYSGSCATLALRFMCPRL
jgi:hypothetical protein